jgi:O-antigen/teichoic acid export membrane protein
MSRYAAYAVAGVFSALPPFFLMPVLTGSLSTSEFATTTLVWSALTLLIPIIGLGSVNSASVRYFKLSGKEFANHLRSIFLLIVISSAVLLLLGLLINYGVYKFFPVEISAFVLIIIIATLLSFGQLFASLAVVSSRPYTYLKFYFFYGSISVLSVYVFLEYFGLKMTGFYAGLLLAASALSALSYFTYKDSLKDGQANFKECRSALLFGMPLMFHSVALNLSSTIDRFI